MNKLLKDSKFNGLHDKELGDFTLKVIKNKIQYLLNNRLIAKVLCVNRKISHLIIYDTKPELVHKFISAYHIDSYSYIFKTRERNCMQYKGIIKPYTYAIGIAAKWTGITKYPRSLMFRKSHKRCIFDREMLDIIYYSQYLNILDDKKRYRSYRFAQIQMYYEMKVDIVKLLNVFEFVFCGRYTYRMIDGEVVKSNTHRVQYVMAKALIADEKRYSNTKSARN